MASVLLLTEMQSLQTFSSIKILPEYFRGDWLFGFGWDQFQFSNGKMPSRKDLDLYFPNYPVYFVRRDGHSVWINSKAYEFVSAKIKLSNDSGVYLDAEMNKISKFLPPASEAQKKNFLSAAIQELNSAGFTHARDMSCDETQWNLLAEMDQRNELSLYVENNFDFETTQNFEKKLNFAIHANTHSEQHMRVDGMKFYIDGALGSNGAWLSQNYEGLNHAGLQLWKKDEVSYLIRKSWENKLGISVHALGDQASAFVSDIALEIWNSGLHGKISIEHAEVMSHATISKLAKMLAIIHMQPCHWLSDKKWLKQKLGSLYSSAFPWNEIEKSGLTLQWGSDSPIEKASIQSTMLGLEESKKDAILGIKKNAFNYYSHHDTSWGTNCQTIFDTESNKVDSVIFDNKKL